jgi:hypothetical protein
MKKKISIEESLEGMGALADTLVDEEVLCPVSRIQLVTWIAYQLSELDTLIDSERELPLALRERYAAWIHLQRRS